jgi:curved DNA-binding protein
MNMANNKDYYNILGIDRGANADEVHRAYRRRARELHPDRHKQDPRAEDRFKELGEAYRILSNPQKRKQYDMFGSVGGDYAPPPDWGRGRFDPGRPIGFDEDEPLSGLDFNEIFDDLLGRMSGPSRRAGSGARRIRVDFERGSDIEVELPVTVDDLLKSALRQIRVGVTRRCEKCDGEGAFSGAICAACGGSGRLTRRKTYRIRIPAGLGDGNVIRLAGQGHPSPGGVGPAGDLLVRLRLKAHSKFRVQGRDLELDLRVPDYQAALGAKVSFETPHGPISVDLPAGIKSGAKLKIRGKGLPKRGGGSGNLMVNVIVAVPEKPTPEQKDLYERLRSSKK